MVKTNKELAQKVKEQEEIISNLKKINQKNSYSIPDNKTNSTVSIPNPSTSNLNQFENNSNYLQQNPQVDTSNDRFESSSSEQAKIYQENPISKNLLKIISFNIIHKKQTEGKF